MAERARGRLGYVPALDGLRGVAILLVMGIHFFQWPAGGPFGVDLFFALSGFLITSLLLEERDRTGRVSLRHFYERRARRLLPALLALLATYLVVEAFRGRDGLGYAATYGLYMGNAQLSLLGGHPGALGHLWSLAQEEQFYLVWPLLLLVLVRFRRPGWWIIGAAVAVAAWRAGLSLHGASFFRLDFGPDTRSVGLLAGSALAAARLREAPGWVAPLALSVFGFAVLARPGGGGPVFFAGTQPLAEIAATGLVFAAVSGGGFARWLAWRPLVWIGRVSYSLYLWHWLIWSEMSFHWRPMAIVLSFLAAWASWRFVEQPFRRRSRRSEAYAPSIVTAS